MTDKKSSESRRKLLKSIAAGSGAIVAGKSLPENWSKPVVESLILPAHAQTSPAEPPTCTTRNITGMRTSLDLRSAGVATFSVNNYLGDDQQFAGTWSGTPDATVTINDTRTISGCTVTVVVNATVEDLFEDAATITAMSWSVESTCDDGNVCTSSGSGFNVVDSRIEAAAGEAFFDVCNSGTECCTLSGLLPVNDGDCN